MEGSVSTGRKATKEGTRDIRAKRAGKTQNRRANAVVRWARRQAAAPPVWLPAAGLALGAGAAGLVLWAGTTATWVAAAGLAAVGLWLGLGQEWRAWVERGKGNTYATIQSTAAATPATTQPTATAPTQAPTQPATTENVNEANKVKGNDVNETNIAPVNAVNEINHVNQVHQVPQKPEQTNPNREAEPTKEGPQKTTETKPERTVQTAKESPTKPPETKAETTLETPKEKPTARRPTDPAKDRLRRELDPWLAELDQTGWKPSMPGTSFATLQSWQDHVVDTIDDIKARKTLRFTSPPGIDMVLIPGGEFWMGASEGDTSAYEDEKPRHRVRVSTFAMAVAPVTQAQWKDWGGVAASLPGFPGPNRPVENVTWWEAVRYCNTVSDRFGYRATYDDVQRHSNISMIPGANGLRLPTEAEWEYAARAGTTTRYFFGDDDEPLKNYAWYDKNSANQTHDVSAITQEKHPNPWGLYDIYGNVWEWCWDSWKDNYTADNNDNKTTNDNDKTTNDNVVDNPKGPSRGASRVIRGGGYWDEAGSLRSSFRNNWNPDFRYWFLGFRIVRSSSRQHG